MFFFKYILSSLNFRIAQPLFLGGLISYFSPGQTEITKNEAYYYATGVVMSMFINVLIVYPFLLYLYHTAMKIRVACCSLIYRKVGMSVNLHKIYYSTRNIFQYSFLSGNAS